MLHRNVNEVADLLEEIGRRAAFEGGNPYKAKAYVRAASTLRRLPRPLGELVEQQKLQTIPGVGANIARRIESLYHGERDEALDRMRQKLPSGLVELLAIPGLKPQTILKLHGLLGISTLKELEAACMNGKVAATKGFGPALERKILQGITTAREGEGRLRMNHAQAVLEDTAAELKRLRPELRDITFAGELRRACELVSDLRLVAVDPGANEVTRETFGSLTLHTCPAARLGATLIFATGNDAHVAQLTALASRKGLSLTPEGLRRNGRLVPTPTEQGIYKALGLQFIPPELREGTDEIPRARKRALPKLVTLQDLKGVLHLHTAFSDGVNTLQDMAEAARERGYGYLGVADHSQSAHYAGGLSLEEIEEQHAMADDLNRRYRGRFRIFKGIESDILADGSLDYPPQVLQRFDFVVASVHSRFKLDRKEQTQRIIAAVSNPFTTILGHPTGRQLLRRPGYDADVDAILMACAKHGVAVEINGNPYRLDLDWRWHRRALELGCLLSINPDAHSIAELDLVKWGVAVARKGGVSRGGVLNCMSRPAISAHLRRRRMVGKSC
jgi:DNA polymerase (family X)